MHFQQSEREEDQLKRPLSAHGVSLWDTIQFPRL